MFPKFWYAVLIVRRASTGSAMVFYRKKYARSWQNAQSYLNEDIVSEFGYGWSVSCVEIPYSSFISYSGQLERDNAQLFCFCEGVVA